MKCFLRNYHLSGNNFDQYHRSVDNHQAYFDPFEWDKMIDIYYKMYFLALNHHFH